MKNDPELVSPSEVCLLSMDSFQLIDVREPIEFKQEHIAGARLIPLGQIEKRCADIDANLPVVVMCHAGKRGAEALKKLQTAGIQNVRNLDGGILAWKAADLPVIKTARNRLPLMQQVQLSIGLSVFTGAILTLTVHTNWAYLCVFFGAGLTLAGSTGWCGLAIMMSKMPWNRVETTSCSSLGK